MSQDKPRKFPAPPPALGASPYYSLAPPPPPAPPASNQPPQPQPQQQPPQHLYHEGSGASAVLPARLPPPPPPPSIRTNLLPSSSTTIASRPVESVESSSVSPTVSAAAPLYPNLPPPPPPPHESIAPTFVLQSAPPSGNNFDYSFLSGASSALSGISETLSQSAMLGSSMLSSSLSPQPTVVSSLPPPPALHPSPSFRSAGGGGGSGGYSPPRNYSALSAPRPQSAAPAAAQVPSTLPPPPVLRPPRPRAVSPPPPPSALATEGSTGDSHEESAPDPPGRFTVKNPPPRLPPTTFVPKMTLPPLLAKRQTHVPILLLATEAAHQLAYKNGLRLADLLEGLVQQQQSQAAQSSSVSSSSSSSYPFRSVSRQIQVTDVPIRFVEPEELFQPPNDELAQQVLSQHALLKEEDGNLQHELTMLEDQVDNLLDESSDDGAGNGGGDASAMNEMDRHSERSNRMEQAVKDAYMLTSPLHIPWLWRYRLAADSVTDGLPWDLTSAPAVVLCVCTTSEEVGLLETLQALVHSPYALPKPYHNGLLDPNAVRKEVLVLHDNVDGPRGDSWNEASLRQTLQQQFGANSGIVRCNSISIEASRQLALEESTDLWGGGGTLGTCLSVADRVSLRKFLTTLITSSLLPAMERRVSDLNSVVSDKKKGVKNVLKSLWGAGRSGASGQTSSTGGSSHGSGAGGTAGTPYKVDLSPEEQPALYRHDSIESQTRLLADSLFLMKDYESALGMYRLIRDDYKQDKAHGHYASVQEMMALCMYLTDPYGRSKDIFSYCENALLGYSRAAEEERPPSWEKPGRPTTAPRSTRSATRLCLVLISTKNICVDRHLEVADLLASASSHETSLGAAVLLEQSSSHYFMAEMYRKYAFHMLMSGHMFRSAEQEHHAFRCFTSALHIYKDSKWEELHNHLRSALAAQLYAMNRMALSLQLYAKLVGSTEGGRVSAKSQQKFVNHLLEICNEHPKKALVGADRMAASAKLSRELRDSVRKDRLERIVQVVRYTKSASRVLELPNISLPGIDDSTIAVLADETASKHDSWIPSLGDVQRGSDTLWDELQLVATAELKVFEGRTKAAEEEIPSTTLSKIEDAEVRKVVAQIDREKAARVVQERAKKREGDKPDFPVRAQMEPLVVEFAITNPLGIPIDLVDMQLVARMTEEDSNRICTNEDAIKITPFVSYDQKQKWSFLGSSVSFEVPDFCRVATSGPDTPKQSWKAAEEVEPFFVLTKQSISLEPESRRTISASICPLARGNLDILGVRSRLLDDVWVYHPFDLKGPLLQNTRANRANRVRAEPTLLKAKVERGMPCLKAELVQAAHTGADDHGPVLQGQVSSWILRLTNVGTAPAINVYLKTNLPWVCIGTEDDQLLDSALETARRPCCIGPSGTLFQIPIAENLKGGEFIDKGESIDIPMRIRATGSGHQSFYLLFRYELFEDSLNASPRYRWLRKMIAVPVYPSIAVSASISSSASPLDHHILSLEVANDRTDRPDHIGLVLDKVTLLSRSYVLEPLPGQFAGSQAILGWQERANVHFRILPLESSTEAIKLSHCRFDDTQKAHPIHESSASTLSFACLDRAYEAFEHVLHSHDRALARAASSSGQEPDHPRSISQIRRANTSAVSFASSSSGKGQRSHATSPARLCPSDRSDETLCIIVCWKDEATKAFGEHYIRDLEIRPPSITKECPICVTAHHPQSCSMRRSDEPVQVPVKITLRNRLTRESIDFLFSVDRSECFDFIGTQCFQSALSGGEEISLALQALIRSPGVYDLQRIRISVEGEEPYVFPMQWLVSVDPPKAASHNSVDLIEL